MKTALASILICGTLLCNQPINIDNYISMTEPANKANEVMKPAKASYAKQLKLLGYYKKDSSNEKLNERNAVLRFQCSCNLVADGVKGDQFRCALISRLMVNGSYKYPDKVLKPASSGYWITINRSKRILTLYKNKTVVRKYPIAIGKENSKTPQGKFRVAVKTKNPVWSGGDTGKPPAKGGAPDNPLGKRWIGLSLGGGDIYGIHGNNKPFSIGKEVSNGCIRMINSDVTELYNTIGLNTPVWVGTDAKLRKWGVTQPAYY